MSYQEWVRSGCTGLTGTSMRTGRPGTKGVFSCIIFSSSFLNTPFCQKCESWDLKGWFNDFFLETEGYFKNMFNFLWNNNNNKKNPSPSCSCSSHIPIYSTVKHWNMVSPSCDITGSSILHSNNQQMEPYCPTHSELSRFSTGEDTFTYKERAPWRIPWRMPVFIHFPADCCWWAAVIRQYSHFTWLCYFCHNTVKKVKNTCVHV